MAHGGSLVEVLQYVPEYDAQGCVDSVPAGGSIWHVKDGFVHVA